MNKPVFDKALINDAIQLDDVGGLNAADSIAEMTIGDVAASRDEDEARRVPLSEPSDQDESRRQVVLDTEQKAGATIADVEGTDAEHTAGPLVTATPRVTDHSVDLPNDKAAYDVKAEFAGVEKAPWEAATLSDSTIVYEAGAADATVGSMSDGSEPSSAKGNSAVILTDSALFADPSANTLAGPSGGDTPAPPPPPPTTIGTFSGATTIDENPSSGKGLGTLIGDDDGYGHKFESVTGEAVRVVFSNGQYNVLVNDAYLYKYDYETAPNHQVKALVKSWTMDVDTGLSSSTYQTLTFTLNDVSEPPILGFNGTLQVLENQVGYVVGEITINDIEGYGTGNVGIAISDPRFGARLQNGKWYLVTRDTAEGKSGIDYETTPNHTLTVTIAVTNTAGHTGYETLTLSVLDGPDAPTGVSIAYPDGKGVPEDTAGIKIGTLSGIDPDQTPTTFTYQIIDSQFETYKYTDWYEIKNVNELWLKPGISLDYERFSILGAPIQIKVTDGTGLSTNVGLSLKVEDLPENPHDIYLSVEMAGGVIPENTKGQRVALVGAIDDFADRPNLIYWIEPSVGGQYFTLSQSSNASIWELFAKPDANIDYEALASSNFKIPVKIYVKDPATGYTTSQTFNVDISDVDEPTTLTFAGQTSYTARATGDEANPFVGVTLTNPDGGDPVTLTIAFKESDGVLSNMFTHNGVTVTSSSSGGIITYTLVGQAATLNTFLDSVGFNPMDRNNGPDVVTKFTFTVTDAPYATITSADAIQVTSYTNSAPQFSVDPGKKDFIAKSINETVAPFEGVSLFDTENDEITVTISFTKANGDLIGMTSRAGVTLVNDVTSGTVRTFTVKGLAADLQSYFDTILFDPKDSTSGTNVVTTFSFTVADASHTAAPFDNVISVTATSVNNAPDLTVVGPRSFTTAATGGLATPFGGVTVSDGENDQVTLTIMFADGDGALGGLGSRNGVTVLSNSTTGSIRTVTLKGLASDLNTYLDGVTFDPTNRASGANVITKFTFTVKDDTNSAAGYSDLIQVISDATNAAPTFSVSGPSTFTTASIGGVVNPFTGINLADVNGDLITLTIAFTNSNGALSGMLSHGNVSVIDNDVAGGIRTYSLTGSAADLQTFLDGITFDPADRKVADFTTNFSFTVKDDLHTPIAFNNAINVVAVVSQTAPTFAVTGPTSFTAAAVGQTVNPFAGVSLDDRDGDQVTLTIKFADGDGVLFNISDRDGVTVYGNTATGGFRTITLKGLASDLSTYLDSVAFDPTDRSSGNNVSTKFTFTVKDDWHTATVYSDAIEVISTPASSPSNASPTLVVAGPTSFTTAASGGLAVPFGGITLADSDGDLITIRIAFADADGVLGALGNRDGVTVLDNVVTGGIRTVTLKGSAASLNNYLDGVTFDPTDRASGADIATKFSFLVMDDYHNGLGNGYSDAITVISTTTPPSNNTAPTLAVTGPTSFTTAANGGLATPFGGVTLADNEGDRITLTIAFTDTEGTLGGVGAHDNVSVISNTVSGGIRTVTLMGSASDLNTYLDIVTFNPTDRAAGPNVTTNFTFTVKDGTHTATSYTNAIQVVSDANNVAPTLSVTGPTSFTTAATGGLATPFGGVTLADNDGDQITLTTAFTDTDGALGGLGDRNGVTIVSNVVSGGIRTVTLKGSAASLNTYLDGVTFDPADRVSGADVSTKFTFTVSDGLHTTDTYGNAIEVISTTTPPSNNTAPTFVVTGPTSFTTAANSGLATPFGGVTLADADGDQVTITIKFTDLDGALGGLGNRNGVTVIDNTASGGLRTVTLKGLASDLNTYLDGVTFNPTDRGPGPNVTTNFTFTVKDDSHTATAYTNA
ncbi:beta strand repeat-containing protein, partial [Microvirga puerhi]